MDRVRGYYESLGDREWSRLDTSSGTIEFEVNRRIISQYLPADSRVLDIGGGPGRYSLWLASLGHEVVLADLSPRLLDIARARIAESAFRANITDVVEADVRDLSTWEDGEFDAALSLGPFYHLPETRDREQASQELRRVVRVGGRVFVAFMPWQALLRRTAAAPQERHRLLDEAWVSRLIEHGRFSNDVPGGFDIGFGAAPSEVVPFFEALGFETVGLFASEGLASGIEETIAEIRRADQTIYDVLMGVIATAASDPSLFGLTTHLLYVGNV